MSNMYDGYQVVLDAMARGFEPDPNLTVDQWSDLYMIIPKSTGSNEHGPYRTSRTPHAREVMRALSDNHPCKRVVVMAASQMLKTQCGLNWLGASIHQSPSNFLWLMPTGKLAKRIASRIDKTIQAVPQLRDRVATPHSRDATNNTDTKEYIGGTLFIATAGAAANLSEVPARRVLFDEVDRAETNVNGEGDPIELAEARQTTFERNRKAYYPSSPTIEGESIIQGLFKRGTQRHALADCIHCGHAQPLEFERLIRSEDGQNAYYPCIECGALMSEGDKTRMFLRGAWSEGSAGDGSTESFTISALFLPYGWVPWIALMRQYDQAKAKLDEGSEEAMIVFYNTRLASCWVRAKEATRYDELMQRAEPYKLGTVPMGGLVLTAAIDTQPDRLELKVVAWGEGMECWIVDYQIILGDPSEDATWARADAMLQSKYRHSHGQMLGISACFIDSGGSNTQDVYNYTGPRRRRYIYAIKGASRPDRPVLSSKPTLVDINHRGKSEKRGAQLWFVGTDTAKDYLAARWKRLTGPGAVHFSTDLAEDYFKQLTAEYRTTVWKRGRKTSVWEKKQGDRNEALDVMVYNLAAAHYLGLHKKKESHWQALRDRVMPMVSDLFATIEQSAPAPAPAPEPFRRLPPVSTTATSQQSPVAHHQASSTPQPPPAVQKVTGGRISLSGLRRSHA